MMLVNPATLGLLPGAIRNRFANLLNSKYPYDRHPSPMRTMSSSHALEGHGEKGDTKRKGTQKEGHTKRKGTQKGREHKMKGTQKEGNTKRRAHKKEGNTKRKGTQKEGNRERRGMSMLSKVKCRVLLFVSLTGPEPTSSLPMLMDILISTLWVSQPICVAFLNAFYMILSYTHGEEKNTVAHNFCH